MNFLKKTKQKQFPSFFSVWNVRPDEFLFGSKFPIPADYDSGRTGQAKKEKGANDEAKRVLC